MRTIATYSSTGHMLSGADTDNDPFHDPLILGIGIAIVAVTLVMLAMGGVYYWGELYGAPSWGAHSFPPPAIY
jgi:hypothetical protein